MRQKLLIRILLFPILGIFLYILVACIIQTPTLVFREIAWRDSDVFDYKRFPFKKLEASSSPFYFQNGSPESAIETLSLLQSSLQCDDLDAFLESTGTQAFIVIHNDQVLYEKYFNGSRRDTIVTSFSAAKSFLTALVGIAINDGKLSINDPITQFLPELAIRDPRFSDITVQHLLMSSSGIQFSTTPFPFFSDDGLAYYHPNLRYLALERTRIWEKPGQHFLYNHYDPILLGLILERVTGTPVTQYLQERLWTPLGMEYEGSWSLDSDSDALEKMGNGINARAIDFAKLGRLYLMDGNWNGMQLISADWIAESTQEDDLSILASSTDYYDYMWSELHDLNGYYPKYMWWGMHREDGKSDFMAWGALGQYIYVSPQANLIVVRNGEEDGISPIEWVKAFYLFATRLK